MVAIKHCPWRTCKNDSRYPHLLSQNKNGDSFRFIRFPPAERWRKLAEKIQRWIVARHRGDTFVCSNDIYICSLVIFKE